MPTVQRQLHCAVPSHQILEFREHIPDQWSPGQSSSPLRDDAVVVVHSLRDLLDQRRRSQLLWECLAMAHVGGDAVLNVCQLLRWGVLVHRQLFQFGHQWVVCLTQELLEGPRSPTVSHGPIKSRAHVEVGEYVVQMAVHEGPRHGLGLLLARGPAQEEPRGRLLLLGSSRIACVNTPSMRACPLAMVRGWLSLRRMRLS